MFTNIISKSARSSSCDGICYVLERCCRLPGMSLSKLVPWELPSHLKCNLEGWGGLLKRQVVQASAAAFSSGRKSALVDGNRTWRVATDCSGVDAPIWSLRLMHVPHTHVYASDIWPVARDFIALNSKPSAEICKDMCARQVQSVPHHDIYICGFPCQPFSTLHHGTTFFQEAKSRPFRAMLRLIGHCKASVVVLENVHGILRVLEKTAARSLTPPGLSVDHLEIGSKDVRPTSASAEDLHRRHPARRILNRVGG